MGHYIISFLIYTMAMIGLIFFAVFVYKKFSISCVCSKRKGFINLEDALSLSPRKVLYVVKAGNERFLIASDTDRTTLISKLNTNNFEGYNLDEIDKINNI
ncbi:FliO/MopB family protein [bacterium]|nr:FliO/MopB family protein [bacterium]